MSVREFVVRSGSVSNTLAVAVANTITITITFTFVPSGIIIKCQETRSLTLNRAKARKILAIR